MHVPSPKVKAIDSTGAGDSFIGALAYGISQGDALPVAAAFACRAAAYSVQRAGTQISYGTREQLEQAL